MGVPIPMHTSSDTVCRPPSKRLVPTNVDMYRMYRHRDMLQQRRLSTDAPPGEYHGWLRSTVGGTPVFGRRTDPVLRSTFS